MLYIVYHISIIYIYFVTGGATGCHNFSLYHFDGGSFRFSRNQCVYLCVHVYISIVNASFSFNLCVYFSAD